MSLTDLQKVRRPVPVELAGTAAAIALIVVIAATALPVRMDAAVNDQNQEPQLLQGAPPRLE